MRIEYVECKSRNTAINRCPWAAKVMKCYGGYTCYESVDDYETAKRQK